MVALRIYSAAIDTDRCHIGTNLALIVIVAFDMREFEGNKVQSGGNSLKQTENNVRP